jgi:CRP-like cAMP-binding protein
MTLSTHTEWFSNLLDIFSVLDDHGCGLLAGSAAIERVPAEQVILRQGERGDAFYMIASGAVRVLVSEEEEGATAEVARLGAGDLFGEMGAVANEPRSATIQAVGPCSLVRFEGDSARAVLREHPALREYLCRVGLARTEANLSRMADFPVFETATPAMIH